jgi:SAM-dependent methyltransferase
MDYHSSTQATETMASPTSDFIEVTSCRACGGTQLREYLNLNDQPLANSYHRPDEELKTFPLRANVCMQCWHSQLSVVVNPDLMFAHYLYVSGTSKTLRDYFDYFAKLTLEITRRRVSDSKLNVLDIACNDGSQLDAFKRLNSDFRTFGVDPAQNLVPLARKNGHNVLCEYWNNDSAVKLGMTFDIITAQNVFAHTHDALGFLKACKKVMHEQTVLFIQTSQANMIPNGEFDTMYHEHLSFFTTLSMNALVERAGMKLERVERTDIHGTSYVFMITLNGNAVEGHNVGIEVMREGRLGLYKWDTYENFGKNAVKVVTDLREAIDKFASEGRFVIGYGAAAKGMTLLNFGNIPLDFIIDDNPLKVGLLTPGTNISIFGPETLAVGNEGIVFIPLAWNFATEIKNKIKTARPNKNDIFVKYFPELVVETE